MAETDEIIDSIKGKLQTIISLYETSKEGNQTLKNENQLLKGMLVTKDEMLNELETKNRSLNLSKAFVASSEDSIEAKMKVTKIVREIDKCIALLNK